ncbi:cAMP-responsive element modulator-like [Nylanderia fulva]|uniref:cAMP-responsive element modulator-like n=1 Tax=Nylanderia fulva TaxID=613905 RepID=UPI0010FB8F4E|nr:cAMP-responsive element modulator-like [Nylanderia fulva]
MSIRGISRSMSGNSSQMRRRGLEAIQEEPDFFTKEVEEFRGDSPMGGIPDVSMGEDALGAASASPGSLDGALDVSEPGFHLSPVELLDREQILANNCRAYAEEVERLEARVASLEAQNKKLLEDLSR